MARIYGTGSGDFLFFFFPPSFSRPIRTFTNIVFASVRPLLCAGEANERCPTENETPDSCLGFSEAETDSPLPPPGPLLKPYPPPPSLSGSVPSPHLCVKRQRGVDAKSTKKRTRPVLLFLGVVVAHFHRSLAQTDQKRGRASINCAAAEKEWRGGKWVRLH